MQISYDNGFVTKDRTVWRAVLTWRDENGKKHRKSKSTGIKCYAGKDNRNKARAEAYLRSWRDELVRQQEDELQRLETISFTDYCRGYLDLTMVKATTMSGYTSIYKKIVGTPLGNRPLCEVTADDIRAWEKGLREDGYAEATLAHAHAFVAMVLKAATIEGKIPRNPILPLRAPKRSFKPVNSLSVAQRNVVLNTMDSLDDVALANAVRIALLTGMRRGEICALRWQDVDLEGRTIHVVHALTKDNGFIMSTPKDPAGGDTKRIVPIGRILAGYLGDLKRSQISDIVAAGGRWSDSIFVIGDPLTGTFCNPDALGRRWSMLADAMGWKGSQGEKVRFHDLRHSFATLVIQEGVMDVMSLAKIMGHRDASMTLNVYADALDEAKRSGMDALDASLASLRGGPAPEDDAPRPRGKHMRVPA